MVNHILKDAEIAILVCAEGVVAVERRWRWRPRREGGRRRWRWTWNREARWRRGRCRRRRRQVIRKVNLHCVKLVHRNSKVPAQPIASGDNDVGLDAIVTFIKRKLAALRRRRRRFLVEKLQGLHKFQPRIRSIKGSIKGRHRRWRRRGQRLRRSKNGFKPREGVWTGLCEESSAR